MHKTQILRHRVPVMIVMWFFVWVVTQGLFMSEILTRLSWGVNTSYVIATIWVFILLAGCLIAIPTYRKESLPKSRLLWLYSIPAVLLFLLPQHYGLTLNLWIYMFMILVTVFWQDYLTFGVLQPAISKRISPNKAAALTAIVFILGHIVFFLDNIFEPQMLPIVLAGFVFAFSRRYFGNIYVANIIHTIFYLI